MTTKECLKRIDEKNYLTEREHKEFLTVVENDLNKLKNLEEENEELKEANKFLLNMSIDVHNEKEELKKALEILKDKLELYFKVEKDKDGNNYYYLFQKVCENYLTSKEYEFLKDVFEND